MEWPACSPDVNHNRARLGRSREDEFLAANHTHKLSKNWKKLFWRGDKIPQLVINNLIDSLPQRGGSIHALVPYHWQTTNICLRSSDSLVSYSCGTHNNIVWTVRNVLAPDFSSDIWSTLFIAPSLFLRAILSPSA
ncbi:hypothetical protein TNCV_1271351 [Trichonephila clavipes]|nr:hypothetical protein TNCV_1271351 [Trichonephila clavipes]